MAYHWRVFLQVKEPDTTEPTMKAVILNMIPGADAVTSVLMSSSVDVPAITGDKVEYSIQPSEEITVGKLREYITDNDFDKYRFDDTGSGCRWWCAIVLGHLEKKLRVIPAGAYTEFERKVEALFKTVPSGRIPMPIRKGEFYGSNRPDNIFTE
ncbi:hypothetical protein M422DRAFT_48783 [Sphaerobolus stellatus SS14]|uniref:DUF7770 domain-containing protein n=1 Tax=Sphaerobolus stellatus (strain SS14) TaxID=990650 RepID=A0A0C9UE97_SPHS4|nr:hypothetical protein M422DRAFT_48783 [Sphaerobolus stellatus SS14]